MNLVQRTSSWFLMRKISDEILDVVKISSKFLSRLHNPNIWHNSSYLFYPNSSLSKSAMRRKMKIEAYTVHALNIQTTI